MDANPKESEYSYLSLIIVKLGNAVRRRHVIIIPSLVHSLSPSSTQCTQTLVEIKKYLKSSSLTIL